MSHGLSPTPGGNSQKESIPKKADYSAGLEWPQGLSQKPGGGSGLSSGVFVGCLSRDAWDWGHCSSIVSSGPAGHCHRGPSSPWPEHPLYFSHSLALRKDIKDQRDVLFRFVWGLILNTWFPGPNFGTFNLFCSA